MDKLLRLLVVIAGLSLLLALVLSASVVLGSASRVFAFAVFVACGVIALAWLVIMIASEGVRHG